MKKKIQQLKKWWKKRKGNFDAAKLVFFSEHVLIITDKAMLTNFAPVAQYIRLKYMLKGLRERNEGLAEAEIMKAEKALYNSMKKAAKGTSAEVDKAMKERLN